MNLSKFPRQRYTVGCTPLEFLPRLTQKLGGPQIWLKRDDLLGLAAGGNKTRKLEFLVADALSKGADTLITRGAIQSNHCRLTLAAARKEGLKCHLVLEEKIPNTYDIAANGNNLLYQIMGVDGITVLPSGADFAAAMQQVAGEIETQGGCPYIIPMGGSSPIGNLGYVACAEEIMFQAFEQGIDISAVVCSSGSGGTQAGLAVGFAGNNTGIKVMGINIIRTSAGEQQNIVTEITRATAALLNLKLSDGIIECLDGFVGDGYAIPSSEMLEAVMLLAQTEAILADPVYTGKALAGMISLIRSGYFKVNDNIVFVHTGGSPALYYFNDYFSQNINNGGNI